LDIQKVLGDLVDKYNKRLETDKELRERMKGVNKRIVLEITGDNTYHIIVANGTVIEFGQGDSDPKDLTVTMDKATYERLHNKETSPFQAYADKKISFKGNLADLLVMKGILMD